MGSSAGTRRAKTAFVAVVRAMSRRAVRVLPALGIGAGILAAISIGLSGSEPLQAQSGYTFTGVASCAGSTCHGRSEGNGAIVRQDEIATWQSPSAVSGAHSRAFNVLQDRRGRQIVASLGYSGQDEAENCYGCHATFAPVSQRGPKFQLDDGVGCESCHGASIGWLESHYEIQGTHANNVANGLTPLDQPQARARVCLDCHYGSTERGQFVTHAMMAAGHPRITFELDLFSAFQQHHDVDEDYVQRKGRPDSVRLWAVGQAEAVARATDLFARPAYGTEGVFPQLYFYDCHSCHRPITDGEERRLTFETNPGRPITFGQPPFNDENIIMLNAVADTLAPGRADSFRNSARAFHSSMNQGRAEAQQAAIALRQEALALSQALSSRSYGGNAAFTVVERIGSNATAPRFTDYAGSVQAVMAVDTLLNAMVSDGRVTVGAAAGIRASINRAYDAVTSPESYRPVAFRTALREATSAIGRLQ